MVEVLGILAVVGVVTIGGLNFYQYALSRYKTNALKSELTTMATTTSINLSKISDPSNFQPRGNLQYPVSGTINSNQTFTLTVSQVPKDICSRLLSEGWTLPYEIKVNNSDESSCTQEGNTMAFSFYNSLTAGPHPDITASPANTGNTTGGGNTSNSGNTSHSGNSSTGGHTSGGGNNSNSGNSSGNSITDPCNPCGAGCASTCETETYRCNANGCTCLNGKVNPPACNQAVLCSQDIVYIEHCDETVTECCPDEKLCLQPDNCCKTAENCEGANKVCVDNICTCPDGYFQDENGNCYNFCNPCSAGCEETCQTETYQCDVNGCECLNGKVNPPTCDEDPPCSQDTVQVNNCDGTVTECCPDNGNVCENDTNCCQTENDCPGNQICVDYHCTCDNGYFIGTDKDSSCSNCCWSCDSTNWFNSTSEACSKCISEGYSRVYMPNLAGGRCIYKANCTPGVTFASDGGGCADCEDEHGIGTTEEDCLSCNVSGIKRTFTFKANGTASCMYGKCSDGKFRIKGGGCANCTDTAVYVTSKSSCDACGDKRTFENNQCSLAASDECESGKFKNASSFCVSCSQQTTSNKDEWKSTQEECEKSCPGSRRYEGSYCLPNCSNGQFQNTAGNCVSCSQHTTSDKNDWKSTQTECENSCSSDRRYEGGYCLPRCESGYFQNTNGDCIPCSQQTTSDKENWKSAQGECENSCSSDRRYEGGYCFPTCQGGYFQNIDGGCIPCSQQVADNNNDWRSTQEECETSCSGDRRYEDGYCLPGCGSDHFRNTRGDCVSCSELVYPTNDKDNWKSTKAECEDNCSSDRTYDGTYCIPSCPDGYFQNSNGNCTDCGLKAGKEPKGSTLAEKEEECGKCAKYNSLYTRTWSSGAKKCSIPTCPTGTFQCNTDRDTNVCRPCYDTNSYKSTESYCKACDGTDYPRTWVKSGGKCVLQ